MQKTNRKREKTDNEAKDRPMNARVLLVSEFAQKYFRSFVGKGTGNGM